MNEDFTHNMNGTSLAYVGDASLEVMVRRFLVGLGITGSGKLNRLALDFVRATSQSAALDNILPHLTEEESYIYKRGRNAHGISIPKSASAREYRRATGFEALFGYLELSGKTERAAELFELAYADVIANIKNPQSNEPQNETSQNN